MDEQPRGRSRNRSAPFSAEAAGGRVRLAGEVDLAVTGELARALEGVEVGDELVLDLAEVEFLDLPALRVLERLAEEVVGLTIASPTRTVRRLLDLTGFSARPDVTIRD